MGSPLEESRPALLKSPHSHLIARAKAGCDHEAICTEKQGVDAGEGVMRMDVQVTLTDLQHLTLSMMTVYERGRRSTKGMINV